MTKISRRDFLRGAPVAVVGFAAAAASGFRSPERFEPSGDFPGSVSIPTKEEMTKFLCSNEIVRSLDSNGKEVPLGVTHLIKDRATQSKEVYAKVEAIPWTEPFVRPDGHLVAPIVVVENNDINKPHFEFVTFGKEGSVRFAHTDHPDRKTLGGAGTLSRDYATQGTLTSHFRRGFQSQVHFAFNEEGLQGGIIGELNGAEKDLLQGLGQISSILLKNIKDAKGLFAIDGIPLGYGFWVQTIR
jgi:hypothetical protein